jgi:hypothetical protein
MVESPTRRGPALRRIDPGDDEALGHLRAEQQARLQFVRDHELWDWLGGVPGWGLCMPAMWGTFAFLGLVLVALLTDGFTRGPVLVAICAARWVVPSAERCRRLLKNGVVVPAAVVQANSQWSDAENADWQPATILWSAAVGPPAAAADLRQVAGALFALKHQDRRALPLEQARLAWDLYHEMGPGPALPVPSELAQGLRDLRMGSAMLPPRAAVGDGPLFVLILPGRADAGPPPVLAPSLLDG